MRLVLSLDAIDEEARPLVGGKGYALGRLRQAGFPVPPGFVVTTEAYRIARAVTLGGDNAPILPAVTRAIMQSYHELGGGAVAVRSSALGEDGAHTSFAGQYMTVLNVMGEAALLDAVRQCWASLTTPQARAYQGEAVAAMAVVIQRMIPAVCAGVAFTADPVSGRRDSVVIEAIIGLGKDLVSGEVAPHHYTLSKGNGVCRGGDDLLDGKTLQAVAELAVKVEAWATMPQDVEWAQDIHGQLYLLQARPITTLTYGSVTLWTRDNVGEVIPEPVTPLSWSVLNPLGNHSFAGVLRRLGVGDYPAAGLFGRFYGRVYFNQTLFQAMMSRFYPSRTGWRAAPRLALTALRALLLLRRLPGESERAITAILEHRRSDEVLDLTDLAPADVLVRLADWRRLGAAAMGIHLTVSVMAELLYQALDKLLARWADETTTAAALTTGLGGVRSAEAGQALAALAERVRRDERLRALVLATAPQSLPARLAETESGRAFWTRIEAFLSKHGHSAAQEFELAAPRWRDDPAIILSALQASVRAGEKSAADPGRTRRKTVAQVEKRLSWPKRVIFRPLLRWAQTLTVIRENLKYHFVIAHSRLRDLYLDMATWLVAADRLSDSEDIFFLTAEEVLVLVEEGLAAVSDCVIERRQAWETDRQVVPPLAFDQLDGGRLCPASPSPPPDGDGGQLLRGFAASPGSYTGRARVVLTPDDGADLEPGEVLVAPATSPGWVPLFLTAGALVTEIGGTLSHGAIIAREYGLPAVLNVTDATRHIRTGQLVHVNGSQGIVRVMERETQDMR